MAQKKQQSKDKKKEDRKLHLAVLKQMVTLATGGFGIVAALAWNNVIQEVVDKFVRPYFPKESGLISLSAYAIIITVIAVIITTQLTRIIEKLES